MLNEKPGRLVATGLAVTAILLSGSRRLFSARSDGYTLPAICIPGIRLNIGMPVTTGAFGKCPQPCPNGME